MQNRSHAMRKQKRKASGFEISLFYWSFLSDIEAVNGLSVVFWLEKGAYPKIRTFCVVIVTSVLFKLCLDLAH